MGTTPSPVRIALTLVALAAIAGCADPVTAPPPSAAPLRAGEAATLDLTVTELGFSGTATAIAANGLIAGNAFVGAESRPIVWDHGVVTYLGTAGSRGSTATGISTAGHVVGRRTAPDGTTDAVLWVDGLPTILPSLGGSFSSAEAISPVGDLIAGYSTLASVAEIHAVLWRDGQIIDIGPAGENSFASAVNEHGQVVGTTSDPSGFGNPYQQAFLWQGGTLTRLGALGAWSIASGINARGQVIGSSAIRTHPHAIHAFLWESGVMTDLGTLGGFDSYANGINARGQIVGISQYADFTSDAYLWERGTMTGFGTADGTSGSVTAINENGQIIGAIGTQPVLWTVR